MADVSLGAASQMQEGENPAVEEQGFDKGGLVKRALQAVRGIRAYHASPKDFDTFKPSEFRGASFFASTPERAKAGAGAGANEMIMETSTVLPPTRMRTYEVEINPTKIRGLHLTPAEQEWIKSAPARIVGDDALEQAMKERPNPYIDWEAIYSPNKIGDRLYEYVKRDELPFISYEDAIRTGRDVYGRQHSHYGAGADEKAAARRVLDQGMGGYLVNDEAGLSIAVADPSIVQILRKYGLPMMAAGAGAASMPDNANAAPSDVDAALDVARRASGGRLLIDQYPTHYLPNVGRQVMADGGELTPQADDAYLDALLAAHSDPNADIREYQRQVGQIAQQPEATRSMTHAPSKPMRPIEIEGGFIGKRQIGEAPYDVAGPLSATAQIGYGMKTLPLYFTPAMPFAAAADIAEAGIDTKNALQKGDYLSAAASGLLGVGAGAFPFRKQAGNVINNAVNAAKDLLNRSPASRAAPDLSSSILRSADQSANISPSISGVSYVTRQDGPFLRVERADIGNPAGSSGLAGSNQRAAGAAGEGVGPGSPADARAAGRDLPPEYTGVEAAAQPAQGVNFTRSLADDYTRRVAGSPLQVIDIPPSSLQKQAPIGRTFSLALEGSPDYKGAVFDAYARSMPDVVAQSGARNYDELLAASYRQMAKETADQFDALPLKFSFYRGGEGAYPNSKAMLRDVNENKHLAVYQGGEEHPFLNKIDPNTGLNENEKFRAVHDAFGHAVLGNPFGAQGEELAWMLHQQMYSPLARLAMTAETRGQNSFVNYTPINAALRSQIAEIDAKLMQARWMGRKDPELERAKADLFSHWQYAPQRPVLLPPEFLSPAYNGEMPQYVSGMIRPAPGTSMTTPITHFSHDPNLQYLDPFRYGTGIAGDEAARLRAAKDIAPRSYGYLGTPDRVVPEEGLGPYKYTGVASNLYNLAEDPARLVMLAREATRRPYASNFNPGTVDPSLYANSIERLAKLYGYSGVANPKAAFPMAAMFSPPPVARAYADGGEVEQKDDPGIVDRALSFLSQFNPVGSAEASPLSETVRRVIGRQTVKDPVRNAFPKIYDDPRVIAAEAAARVAPEDPALKQLFDVTRAELWEMGRGRKGNIEPELAIKENPRGSQAARNVMTPENEQRLIDVIAEAQKIEALRHGMEPWYVMDPAFKKLEEIVGREEAIRYYNRLNVSTGMMSPGTEVPTEINRGLAANYLQEQGRFPEFVRFGGLKASARGSDFPPDLIPMKSHAYHSTSQTPPLERFVETGRIDMQSPKVPTYIPASGVPETGFQTRYAVPDAHFTRAIGMSDTRPGAGSYDVSMKMPEYQTIAPWWRERVAERAGLEAVPAQAVTWGAFSPITGVTSPIGAPKLELLAKEIMAIARRNNISPELARDLVLRGKTYRSGGSVINHAIMIAKELGSSPRETVSP